MSTLGDFLPVQASGWGPGTPGGLSEWPLWGIQKGEDLDRSASRAYTVTRWVLGGLPWVQAERLR